MIQGLYAAANGMIAVEDRQAVIANNIANVSTNGFKRQLSIQKGYYGAFMDSNSARSLNLEIAPGGGIKTTETFSHHAGGSITATGGPLDLALIGNGFFHVQGEDGSLYTRNGQFSVGNTGLLVTGTGLPVLDSGGNEIDVSGGLVEIDETGSVKVDNEIRAQLAVVEFEDPHGMERIGSNLFRASEDMIAGSSQATDTVVAAQSLEMSNVELPVEMIHMMMALRAYAANQKVINSIDETTGRMIDQVGSPS